MQKVLDKLISNDQSGYVKGRYIGTNARVDIGMKNDSEGLLLFLDFENAFDSIE